MKKRALALGLSAILLQGSLAQAQFIDLPNPFEDGPLPPPPITEPTPTPSATPTPTPSATPTATPKPSPTPTPSATPVVPRPSVTPSPTPVVPQRPSTYYNSIAVKDITRKTGGAWYIINFSDWTTISNLVVTAYGARVKIHGAYVIDKNLRRVNFNFESSEILDWGRSTSGKYLSSIGLVRSLHLQLESYGGVATLAAEMDLSNKLDLTYRIYQEDSIDSDKPAPTQPTPTAPGGCRKGSNFVQAIAPWEQEMLLSSSRALSYYAGSAEYNAYARRAQNAAAKITQYARASNLAGATVEQLQSWGASYANKALSYYAGSLEYNTFTTLSRLFYSQVASANTSSLNCSPQSVAQLLQRAASYGNKALGYYAGSTEYNTYIAESRKLYTMAIAGYRQDVRSRNSTQLNNEMLQYENRALDYYAGSVEYNTYVQMSTIASQMAQVKYSKEVTSKSGTQRRREAAAFQSKSLGYYAGSAIYNHFNILARIALNGR